MRRSADAERDTQDVAFHSEANPGLAGGHPSRSNGISRAHPSRARENAHPEQDHACDADMERADASGYQSPRETDDEDHEPDEIDRERHAVLRAERRTGLRFTETPGACAATIAIP